MEFPFFGLGPGDREKVLIEQTFLLMYYGGFTWTEATTTVPVAYKSMFIDRISKEISRSSEKGETMSRGMHQNTPELRELMGRSSAHTPSRRVRQS